MEVVDFIKRGSSEVMRSYCEVGIVNVMPVLVSSCSDEWFYGMERGGEGNKVRVILEMMSHSDDFTALLGTSCPAGQVTEYCGAWSPELAHRRQGARQSNQRNVAVYWVYVARLFGGYNGQIL